MGTRGEGQGERERSETGKQRERVQERSHTCINLDKTGLTDYPGNVMYPPGCNLKRGTWTGLPESEHCSVLCLIVRRPASENTKWLVSHPHVKLWPRANTSPQDTFL